MTTFKCKMCGGALEITSGATVIECEYCGTQQTLPRLDNDKRANMYDRANHFRRNNEFDKAMGIYEQILNEDKTDAEAYWSIVLCRFGIEYVEDPASHKRIPTVNRAQFTSVFDDDNYKSALQYADADQRAVYEAEAKTINEIQKGILAISQKEEPFDVFICYKETDNNGRRTPDSVLAQELYYQLKQEELKVFFARITLEDKLGSAYEPYIFAALNSAKVMVVLGTKPEYFNAVWVKNEWSRYLALIKQGQKKILIPAYRDMDPYDLPEEFSHLHAQDMSKLGFMQDLIRGIKKLAQTDEPKTTIVKETVIAGSAGNANTASLLRRAFLFLEDEEWQSADEYCEKVLDNDPENAEAYLGKLMAELEVCTREELKDCEEPFDDSNNYSKVMRFGSEELVTELEGYINAINERNIAEAYDEAVAALLAVTSENDCLQAAELFADLGDYRDAKQKITECHEKVAELNYNKALQRMQTATDDRDFLAAAEMFEKIVAYRDAKQMAETCLEKISELYYNKAMGFMQTAHNDGAYLAAAELFEKLTDYRDAKQMAESCHAKAKECIEIDRKNGVIDHAMGLMTHLTVDSYQKAITELESLNGWKNSDDLIEECKKKIEELTALARERARQEKRKRVIGISITSVICFAIALFLLLNYVIIPTVKYNGAVEMMDNGKYEEAIDAFVLLEDFKDSVEKIDACEIAILDRDYNAAVALMEEGKFEEAIAGFEALDGYKDSITKINDCNYNKAVALMDAGKYDEAISAFEALDDYRDSVTKINDCKYDAAVTLMNAGNYVEAIAKFNALKGYENGDRNSILMADECRYLEAVALMDSGKYEAAITAFRKIESYKDSNTKIEKCNTIILDGKYDNAIALLSAGNYIEAHDMLVSLDGYKDSMEYLSRYTFRYDQIISVYTEGKETETIEYTYNNKDLLIKMLEKNKYGNTNTIHYTYDSKDRLMKEVYKEWTDYTTTTEYTYDSKDKPIKKVEKYYDSNNNKWDTRLIWEYTYDSKGNLIKEVNMYSSGEISYTFEYTYDNRGNRIKETYDYSFNEYPSYIIYTYDSKGNLIKEEYRSYSWNKLSTDAIYEYIYDSKGTLMKRVRYNSYDDINNDKYSKMVEYIYDSKGNLIMEKIKHNDGRTLATTEYTYIGEHVFYE